MSIGLDERLNTAPFTYTLVGGLGEFKVLGELSLSSGYVHGIVASDRILTSGMVVVGSGVCSEKVLGEEAGPCLGEDHDGVPDEGVG
jgi:hypothetical protein